MIEPHFFLERQSRINADFFSHHTIRSTAICISDDKSKTTIAVLIQFCQPFPFFRFPLHSPLPKSLFFSLFNLVKLLLCIINSKLLQIFSGSHSIHMKAFPVMLVHLFRRASIGEQPLLAFSETCFLSLSLRQFLFLCHSRNLPDFFLMILGCAFSVLSDHGSKKAGL